MSRVGKPGSALHEMRVKRFGLQTPIERQSQKKIPKKAKVDPLQSLGTHTAPPASYSDAHEERTKKELERKSRRQDPSMAPLPKQPQNKIITSANSRSSLMVSTISNFSARERRLNPKRDCKVVTINHEISSIKRQRRYPHQQGETTKRSAASEVSRDAATVAKKLPPLDPKRQAVSVKPSGKRKREPPKPTQGSADMPFIIDDDDDDDEVLIQEKAAPASTLVEGTSRRRTRSSTRNTGSYQSGINNINDETLLLQYPCGANAVDAVNISIGDYNRLEDTEFLNDNLVDFYLKYLTTQPDSPLLQKIGLSPEDLKTQVHVFSSHFFTKLTESRITKVGASNAHKRVERWTRKIDIFKLKYIMVPVVQQLHWSLAVICHPDRIVHIEEVDAEQAEKSTALTSSQVKEKAKSGDNRDDAVDIESEGHDDASQNEVDPEQPCIVFMDSLKLHKEADVYKALRLWLQEEYKKRLGKETDYFMSKTRFPLIADLKLPRQKNGWDCGVFVLRYARELLSSLFNNDESIPQLRISAQAHNDRFAGFDFARWFRQADITKMRTEIKNLIMDIKKQYQALCDSTKGLSDGDKKDESKEVQVSVTHQSQHSSLSKDDDILLDNSSENDIIASDRPPPSDGDRTVENVITENNTCEALPGKPSSAPTRSPDSVMENVSDASNPSQKRKRESTDFEHTTAEKDDADHPPHRIRLSSS